MAMDTSKVLRLPGKLQLVFRIMKHLRAAAPAADPGKEKAGFIRVFCELSAWMLYIYIIYIYASNSIYLCVELKFC